MLVTNGRSRVNPLLFHKQRPVSSQGTHTHRESSFLYYVDPIRGILWLIPLVDTYSVLVLQSGLIIGHCVCTKSSVTQHRTVKECFQVQIK